MTLIIFTRIVFYKYKGTVDWELETARSIDLLILQLEAC